MRVLLGSPLNLTITDTEHIKDRDPEEFPLPYPEPSVFHWEVNGTVQNNGTRKTFGYLNILITEVLLEDAGRYSFITYSPFKLDHLVPFGVSTLNFTLDVLCKITK